jgi:beta-glucanase (GH16 family)
MADKVAFSSQITFSGVRDEIDFEWVGASGSNGVQSNWYWEGLVPDDDRGIQHNYTADSSVTPVEVAIDWQEDTLQWLINGQIVRTVNKNDTVDSNGLTNYPDTPSRIQFGVWASGVKGSSQSTKEWGKPRLSWPVDPSTARADDPDPSRRRRQDVVDERRVQGERVLQRHD